jgi:hypothetical protein
MVAHSFLFLEPIQPWLWWSIMSALGGQFSSAYSGPLRPSPGVPFKAALSGFSISELVANNLPKLLYNICATDVVAHTTAAPVWSLTLR